MPTIAIVGAGPGLGLAIAHRFGGIDVLEYSPPRTTGRPPSPRRTWPR
jgi:hypothetical protein